MTSIDSEKIRGDYQRLFDRTGSLYYETTIKESEANRILHPRDETFGVRTLESFFDSDIIRIIGSLFSAMSKTKSPEIIKQTQEITLIIIDLLISVQKTNYEISNIPSLHVTNLEEEESLLIEWLFVNYRIGFNIRSEAKDSTWYLIATGSSANSGQFGSLSEIDKKALLAKLVSIILSNS